MTILRVNAVKIIPNNQREFELVNCGQFDRKGLSNKLEKKPVKLFMIDVKRDEESIESNSNNYYIFLDDRTSLDQILKYEKFHKELENFEKRSIHFAICHLIDPNIKTFHIENSLHPSVATPELIQCILSSREREENLVLFFIHLDVFQANEKIILRICTTSYTRRKCTNSQK